MPASVKDWIIILVIVLAVVVAIGGLAPSDKHDPGATLNDLVTAVESGKPISFEELQASGLLDTGMSGRGKWELVASRRKARDYHKLQQDFFSRLKLEYVPNTTQPATTQAAFD
jgi:hypothetical protein